MTIRYPTTIAEATLIQQRFASQVIIEDRFDPIYYFGGMDVSFNPYDKNQIIHAAIVVIERSSLSVCAVGSATEKQEFPYVPGYLGFREAPSLANAFNTLAVKPQLIFVDGHGISHPRGLGIASHIGVLLDIPTIGVAKSILVGKPAQPLGLAVGSTTPLIWKNKNIATILRSKSRCLPLIISAGHRVSQDTAVKLTQECITKYRLPEPTRQAHIAANECRLSHQQADQN